jgi:hypothetical protein
MILPIFLFLPWQCTLIGAFCGALMGALWGIIALRWVKKKKSPRAFKILGALLSIGAILLWLIATTYYMSTDGEDTLGGWVFLLFLCSPILGGITLLMAVASAAISSDAASTIDQQSRRGG